MVETRYPQPPDLSSIERGRVEGYDAQSTYIRNEGVLQIPVSEGDNSEDQECILVKTSAAWGRKIVIWVASAAGHVPVSPSQFTNDPNEVLDSSQVAISDPKIIEDGMSFRVVVTGRYEYALLKPPKEKDGYLGPEGHYLSTPPQAAAGGDRFKTNGQRN